MIKIKKHYNLIVILMFIGVMVYSETGYALRPPSHFSKKTEEIIKKQHDIEIEKLTTIQTKYAIALVVKDDKGRILYSRRNPDFYKIFPNVWGLAFSNYITKDQFEVIMSSVGNSRESELIRDVLADTIKTVESTKLDNRV